MDEDIDIKASNEMMHEWSSLQIADYCLSTGNYFWDLITYIDLQWLPKLIESFFIALNQDNPEIIEELLGTSLHAFACRAVRENAILEETAKILSLRGRAKID